MCSTPRGGRTYRPQARVKPISCDNGYSEMIRRSEISYARRQQERLQQRLNSAHPHADVLSIERLACPVHLIKLKQALAGIEPLQRLRVIPGCQALIADLSSACHLLGHPVEQVDTSQGAELYVTRMESP